jgi:hypothetical protein
MSELEIEVNGLNYVCTSDGRAIVESSRFTPKELAFRRNLYIDGNRYVLKELRNFGKWNGNKAPIPNSVEIIDSKCFSGCLLLIEVVCESESNLKEIKNEAFSLSGLKSIRIPNSVKKLGDKCFMLCKSLYEVVFESGSQLEEIGHCALYRSNVERIEIPPKCSKLTGSSLRGLKSVGIAKRNNCFVLEEDLLVDVKKNALIRYFGWKYEVFVERCFENISDECFYECKSLREVIFESGSQLKIIGKRAFSYSGVKTIEIPPKCGKLSGISLHGLNSLVIPKANKYFVLKDDFLLNKRKRNALFRYFGNDSAVFVGNNIEIICGGCFYDCRSLSEVIFESGCKLKEIRNEAFCCSGLKSIRIPKHVERLGNECFYVCKSLSEVTFEPGSKLKEIGNRVLCWSILKSLQIPKSVEKLGNECFLLCKSLSVVSFESGSRIKEIGNAAFYLSGLKWIRIPKHVQKLRDECFSMCRSLYMVAFELECDLKEIAKNVFHLCGLESIQLPSSVEELGDECFLECKSLSEVTFRVGSRLRRIGNGTFHGCGLKSFVIPNSVERLGNGCFRECKSLCEVKFEPGSKLKEIRCDCFANSPLKCVKIAKEFNVEYNWPKGCSIEYIRD